MIPAQQANAQQAPAFGAAQPPPQQPAAQNQNAVLQQLRNISTSLANMTNGLGTDRPSAPNMGLPAKYRGRSDTRDFEAFLKELYRVQEYYQWNENRLARILPMLLEGEALSIYDACPRNVRQDWRQICDLMYHKFMQNGEIQRIQRKLQNRKQYEHESIYEFAAAIYNLVTKGWPQSKGYTDQHRSDIAVNAFRNGLKPSLREHVLRRSVPRDLDSAINDALAEEQVQQDINGDPHISAVNALASQMQNLAMVPQYGTYNRNHPYRNNGCNRWRRNNRGFRRGFARDARDRYREEETPEILTENPHPSYPNIELEDEFD